MKRAVHLTSGIAILATCVALIGMPSAQASITAMKVSERSSDTSTTGEPSGDELVVISSSRKTLKLNRQTVTEAKLQINPYGPPAKGESDRIQVWVRLSDVARKEFAAMTTESLGKKIFFRLGETELSAPIVRTPIVGGALVIVLGDAAIANLALDATKKYCESI